MIVASDPPGCFLGASGCLWVPLVASWVSFLGVSWVSPEWLLVSPGCLLGVSWCLLGVPWSPGSPLFCDVSWVASPQEQVGFPSFVFFVLENQVPNNCNVLVKMESGRIPTFGRI